MTMGKEVAASGNIRENILACAMRQGALQFGEFTLSSGETSTFYFDGRLLTLSARGARLLAVAFLPELRQRGVEAVGGPTIGADPMAAAIAVMSTNDGGFPIDAFIVRKATKEHGTGKIVEGPIRKGSKVAIVDDTCSLGGSLLHAIREVEKMGCMVALVGVVLDRNQGGSEEIMGMGYDFLSILKADNAGAIGLSGP
jgi:orotate phosphoribosyltransferase